MLNKLKNNPFFTTISLKKDEVLFSEGEENKQVYIIVSGALRVEKTTNSSEKKLLATLHSGDIFGEGALSDHFKKEVSVTAQEKAELLSIEAADFSDFSQKYPDPAQQFLTTIIEQSNARLLESNGLIIKNYELTKLIAETPKMGAMSTLSLLEKIKDFLELNKICYYETNEVLENFVTLRYNSDKKNKLQDEQFDLIENTKNELEKILKKSLEKSENFYVVPLQNAGTKIGYLVFIKDHISDFEKKIFSSLGASFAGFLK